jgi:hypothetical protein
MAWIMRKLGAWDAVSMDGGSSTALFYRGRLFSRPARALTNLLVVYDTEAAYARVLPHLAPGHRLAERPAIQGEELPCETMERLIRRNLAIPQ